MTDYAYMNNILLIEDNPGDARLIELYLDDSEVENFSLVKARTLAEGMSILAEGNKFAAILLDLMLPDSQGFETLEKLIQRYPNNNIIVLTGLNHKNMAVQAVKAGAQDYLIKGELDSEMLSRSLRYSIERDNIRKRLEESQRVAHIGNWLYDPASQRFEASDEIYRILGLSPNFRRFQFTDLEKFLYPFDIFNQLHTEAITAGGVKRDLRIETPNDDIRYLYVQCQLIRTLKDNTVMVQGIMQDITDRKRSDDELMKTQERYQEIFTQSKDAIFIATFDGKFIDFNASTANLLGYTPDEVGLLDVNQLYEPLKAKRSLLANLSKSKAIKDFEIEIRCKDDQVRYCLLTANIVNTNEFFGYSAIIRDVTEHKQAEELRKARDLATKTAEMRERLLANISHEMRTPMNAIYGLSNLLKGTTLNQEQSDYLASIIQSSELLLGIINDILEISSMQNKGVTFENKDFDLYELLMSVFNVMQHKVKEKDVSLTISIDHNVSRMLNGDKLRLNQILYNLVGNAIKFTETGAIDIQVQKVGEDLQSETLRFAIIDSGIGIPTDKIDNIFETFSRIRYKDKIYEGTGLGLSIVKNLIEGQGGRIWVKSIVGEGSTFFFELTLGLTAPSEAPPSAAKNILRDPTLYEHEPLVLPNIRILLVEDNKINQLVAKKTLERFNKDIYITIAENGKEAIDQLVKAPYDIVLMDIQMPVMDGYEATAYIREHLSHLQKMPIIAMTAHGHLSKDNKVQEYGMNDFVLKPFEPEKLIEKIVANLSATQV